MIDVIFTFVFIAIFVVAGFLIFNEDDNHDEWRGW